MLRQGTAGASAFLLFAGGWSERRDAAGRVHAIAFFEKNTG